MSWTEPIPPRRFDPAFVDAAVDSGWFAQPHQSRDGSSAVGDDDRFSGPSPRHVLGQFRLQFADTNIHVTTLPPLCDYINRSPNPHA
jgi:hypothetical protein